MFDKGPKQTLLIELLDLGDEEEWLISGVVEQMTIILDAQTT